MAKSHFFNACRRWLIVLLLAAAPAPVAAGPASDLIAEMADQAITTLAETETDLASRERRLRAILIRSFDMDYIGRFVIGRYWSRATEEQRHDYLAAFSDYIATTYTRRFGGYSGETLEILAERPASENETFVQTQIVRGEAAPILAEWRVRVDDKPARVVDVLVEGLSMSVSQREEFGSVIRQRGIDGLINILQARSGRLGAQ